MKEKIKQLNKTRLAKRVKNVIKTIKASREEIELIIRGPYLTTHRKTIEKHWVTNTQLRKLLVETGKIKTDEGLKELFAHYRTHVENLKKHLPAKTTAIDVKQQIHENVSKVELEIQKCTPTTTETSLTLSIS